MSGMTARATLKMTETVRTVTHINRAGWGGRGRGESADTTGYLSSIGVSDSLSNALSVDVNTRQDSEDRVYERLTGPDMTDAGCPASQHTFESSVKNLEDTSIQTSAHVKLSSSRAVHKTDPSCHQLRFHTQHLKRSPQLVRLRKSLDTTVLNTTSSFARAGSNHPQHDER